MSDHFIVVVPRDPTLVPTDDVQRRVIEALKRIVPDAENVAAEASLQVKFFDCGQNFARVLCPHCSSEMDMDWWQGRMNDDSDSLGFRLDSYEAPCCAKSVNLNELIYDWAQAFGRFSWTVQSPNIGKLTDAAKLELEGVAGFALVPIQQHV